MYYSSLTMSGFGPHIKPVTYEFDNGVTFITGRNGAGKSIIFDAIQWALFGPTGSTRTLKNRSSIINTSRQSAKVTIEFVHDTYGEIKVTRSLTASGKHTLDVYHEQDGEKVTGGIREKQEFIEQLFGDMRHDVFSSVYMLQSSPLGPPSSFIGANTTQRREILSKIVDPKDVYAKLHKEAKNDLREAKKALTAKQSKVETLREIYNDIEIPDLPKVPSADIAQQLHQAEKMQPKTSNDVVKLRREFERLDDLVESLYEDNNALFDQYDSTKNALSEQKKKKNQLAREIAEFSENAQQAQACADVFEFQLQEVNRKIGNEKEIRDEIQGSINFVEAKESLVMLSDDDGVCVLCGNEINDDSHLSFDNEFSSLEEELKISIANINDLKSEYNDVSNKYENAKREAESSAIDTLNHNEQLTAQRIEELRASLSHINAEIKKSNARIDDAELQLNEVEVRLADYEDGIDSSDDVDDIDLDELYRKKVNAQSQEERVANALKNQREQKEKVETAEEEVKSAQQEVDRLNKEKERTSPNGVISDDIAELMESMSEHATQLYQDLFDADLSIVVTDGDDDNEKTCVMMVDDRDVATYSHGEQLRIYGCIQAGFTLAAYDRTGVWVPMMWDEPSLATDADAVEAIFSIPESVTPDFHQSFIITRDESIDTGENIVIEL